MEEKNIMKEKNIAQSLVQAYQNRVDERDDEQIKKWLSENRYAEKTVDNLSDDDYLKNALKEFQYYQTSKKRDSFAEKLNQRGKKKKSRLFLITILVGAAIVIISFILFYPQNSTFEGQTITSNSENAINKPILMTSNGQTIDLLQEGDLTNGNIVAISDTKDLLNKKNVEGSGFNCYKMPAKFSSKIVLEDGTIVHLNSRSELFFPTSFSTDKRLVQLKGEAFFEVSRSSIPFIVEVDGVHVTVYGTKFNIKSDSSGQIETLLIEGSVGVKFKEWEERLLPNMLCKVDKNRNELSIQQVRSEKYVAWTENKFMYERDRLEDVVRELSYWYGESIEFKNDSLKELSVTMICQRKATIEEMFELMKLSNIDIEFIKTDDGYKIR